MGGGVLMLAKSPRPIHARARATRFVISAKRRCFYARVFPRASTEVPSPPSNLLGPDRPPWPRTSRGCPESVSYFDVAVVGQEGVFCVDYRRHA